MQSSAKDSDSLLSRKDMLQKTPNKPKLNSLRNTSKKRCRQITALVVSALPQMTRLVSGLRVGRALRLLSDRLISENSTNIQAFSLLLCLSQLPLYPSYSLAAVWQTSCRYVNAAALGYTLNPWHIHVWTCSYTTQKQKTQNTNLVEPVIGIR